MKTLIIMNASPYGNQRSYHGFQLARELVKNDANNVRLFLTGDASSAARRSHWVPTCYSAIESILIDVNRRGGKIGVWFNSMDARGLQETELLEGASRSRLAELADWMAWADKTIVI